MNEVEELRTALAEAVLWMTHDSNCPWRYTNGHKPCTCDFIKLRDRYLALIGSSDTDKTQVLESALSDEGFSINGPEDIHPGEWVDEEPVGPKLGPRGTVDQVLADALLFWYDTTHGNEFGHDHHCPVRVDYRDTFTQEANELCTCGWSAVLSAERARSGVGGVMSSSDKATRYRDALIRITEPSILSFDGDIVEQIRRIARQALHDG